MAFSTPPFHTSPASISFLLPPPSSIPRPESEVEGRRRRKETSVFVEAEEACHGGGGGGGNGIGEDQDEGATFSIAWIDKKCLPLKWRQ